MVSQCDDEDDDNNTWATWWRDSHAKVTQTQTNTHTHSVSHGEEEPDEGGAGVPLGWMEKARQQRLTISVICLVFNKNLFIALKMNSVFLRTLECLNGFVLQSSLQV